MSNLPVSSTPFSDDDDAPRPWSPPGWQGDEPSLTRPAFDASQLITREQLAAHLTQAAAWRSLPDGRPLRLQAEGMEFILDDFGGYEPGELRSAHRVLFFATRSGAEMRALLIPSMPGGTEDPDTFAGRVRALHGVIGAWASATFEPAAAEDVMRLASLLWQNVVERLPVLAEKKSPEQKTSPGSDSPSFATCVGSSLADLRAPTISFGSVPTFVTSSPPSSRGPTGTDTP